VLVRLAGKLQPLKRLRIPVSLHTSRVLVYAALRSVPEKFIARSPSGKMVRRWSDTVGSIGGQPERSPQLVSGQSLHAHDLLT
jgi:hypothetical protein